jgi:hypothetical protein
MPTPGSSLHWLSTLPSPRVQSGIHVPDTGDGLLSPSHDCRPATTALPSLTGGRP